MQSGLSLLLVLQQCGQGDDGRCRKRSIDWLHSIGARVLALMGGEPLLRPKFIHKIVDYSAKRDIFVYLPTNGG